MSIESAQAAIALVGKTVRPAHGTERWAFAKGKPRIGKVIDIHIPDLAHPYVLCDFGGDAAYLYPFELEVLTH